jgi:ankyrin repeat protein
MEIFQALINAGVTIDGYDRHNRTPIMLAIRNHNNNIAEELFTMKAKYYKEDNSLNSVLHYAAAYGNVPMLQCLLQKLKQRKNKRNYYPWEVAVGKGHYGCSRILEDVETTEEGEFQFVNNLALMIFKIVDGTTESLRMLRHLIDCGKYDLNEVDSNGANVLHYVCGISQ